MPEVLRTYFLALSIFFFNDTATTEIYTLSLHDALPIYTVFKKDSCQEYLKQRKESKDLSDERSEEHTSELQSHLNLVCRLLLEKKKGAKRPQGDRKMLLKVDPSRSLPRICPSLKRSTDT